ncbi:selenocysteine-specific translation elongation factor [Noviherbaspirillum galbum]|uniref:Selenocysteine-specific elongation factor n=1 Tax=Noviherbaspirillum galbum TaxID=2709383 RepID=A0A6B3SZX9_9BURK|nr:selenocysteine-specific translation elongation factor [Noviherbaspirillum galbum]NEX64899.1 selenocysteine-specific translation elongation factor [Noviherbaspirillum galbum]
MIIATAGHVDHGKTTLVKALTGVDTDRLKEEKLRGMSIEPGFAYLDLGSGAPVGFVDVPGHERFVRNMLAGVAAVDYALLVIAADDGPMPQTHEHLAILELLGIRDGAVAITKADCVSPARLAEAQVEIAAALSPTALCNAPAFTVAATSGAGIEALRTHLAKAARAQRKHPAEGNFRLAVDRCFSLAGTGQVVTGAVASGRIRIGDEVMVSPQGVSLRVRGIHVHNRAAEDACAGWRCALNLAGTDLKKVSIERGDWIVAPDAHVPTERCDVRITVPVSQDKPLAHWTPVHLHCGAAAVNARVALLEGQAIAPGASALAQLIIDRPVMLLRGDRFILRDQSARHTIAGGVALDPDGAVRGRAKPARLAHLAAMACDTPREALERLLDAQPDGVWLDRFVRAWNLTADESAALLGQFSLATFPDAGETRGVTASSWQAMRSRLLSNLREWHDAQPEGIGPGEAMLADQLGERTLAPAWRAALRSLCEEGQIKREGISLRLAEHSPRLSENNAAMLAQVNGVLQASGLRPPAAGEMAKMLGIDLAALTAFLEHASRLGHLVRVARNRFFLPATMDELARVAEKLAGESVGGMFEAAAYRDRSGLGRNVTIEVLEFMDRMRITRYAGGRRRIAA